MNYDDHDNLIMITSSTLDDIERTRISAENRLRQLTRTEVDSVGEERGFGMSLSDPGVAAQKAIVDSLSEIYKQQTKLLQKQMSQHPLGPWVKAQKGLGEKTVARLLAEIGDPYWNDLHDRPRTVSELWAYCGLHVVNGVGAKRTKGQKCNWNTTAGMRLHNIIDPIIKCRESPYRKMYDEIKASYEGRVYDERYAGKMLNKKPIVVGQPLSKGHIESMTQRRVKKQILLDLWLESKRINELAEEKVLVSA